MTEQEKRIKAAVDAKFDNLRRKSWEIPLSVSSDSSDIFPNTYVEWFDEYIEELSLLIDEIEKTFFFVKGDYSPPFSRDAFKILWLADRMRQEIIEGSEEFNLYINLTVFYDYEKEIKTLVNRLEEIQNNINQQFFLGPAEEPIGHRTAQLFLKTVEKALEENSDYKDDSFYIAAKAFVEKLKDTYETDRLDKIVVDLDKLIEEEGSKYPDVSRYELARIICKRLFGTLGIFYNPIISEFSNKRIDYPDFQYSMEIFQECLDNSILALRSVRRSNSRKFYKELLKANLEYARGFVTESFVQELDANDKFNGDRYRKEYWINMHIELNKQLRSSKDVNGKKFIRQNYTPITKKQFTLIFLDEVKDRSFLEIMCKIDIINEIIDTIEKAENGEPVSNTQFSVTAERWVELYDSQIDSKLKGENLVKHLEKLRLRYTEAKAAKKSKWRTSFLRDNIFYPKQPWLNDINSFSQKAIEDLFDDEKFDRNAVSRAKIKI